MTTTTKLTFCGLLLLGLFVAFLYLVAPNQGSVRQLPQQAASASDLRQLTIAFHNRY